MKQMTIFSMLVWCYLSWGTLQGFGQDSEVEDWDGIIRFNNSLEDDVVYKATTKNGFTQFLSVEIFDHLIELKDVKVEKETTMFLYPHKGLDFSCVVKKQENNNYAGNCSSPESSETILMRMHPPPVPEEIPQQLDVNPEG